MSANDEIPRGWTQFSGYATNPSITFPATAGISWVLAAVDLDALIAAGPNSINPLRIFVNGTPLGVTGAASEGAGYSFSWSWSGALEFVAETAVVITTDEASFVDQVIRATAYPV